jgi:hypothetical protein
MSVRVTADPRELRTRDAHSLEVTLVRSMARESSTDVAAVHVIVQQTRVREDLRLEIYPDPRAPGALVPPVVQCMAGSCRLGGGLHLAAILPGIVDDLVSVGERDYAQFHLCRNDRPRTGGEHRFEVEVHLTYRDDEQEPPS